MRRLFPLIAVLLIISSCGGSDNKKSKVDKEALFGSWEENTYENPFFNFKLELSDDWNIDSTQFQISFGGRLFETTYMKSLNMDVPVTIVMEADKANPFAKPSVIKQAEESIEGYEFLFDESTLIKTPLSKTKVAGEEYVLNQLKFTDDTDTSYINEYFYYADGYYLTIICNAGSAEDEEMIRNFISDVKRLK